MTIFNLPDLGEGLPDAEIHEWYVKVGDKIELDTPLVSMETAKALVDVPSPQSGVVKALYGKPGDVILTGRPLMEFENNEASLSVSVVGHIEHSNVQLEEQFTIGASASTRAASAVASPRVRAEARKRGIDLSQIKGTGANACILLSDLDSVYHESPEGYEKLSAVRRNMAKNMSLSHKNVVSVTIFDDACLKLWKADEDITVRLIQAIAKAIPIEPALNAHYHGESESKKCFSDLDLGLAIDGPDGLFVPVIKAANTLKPEALRQKINELKQGVVNRTLSPDAFHGGSFTLSNFGKFAGRYAEPVVVPPSVAILGIGAKKKIPLVINDKIEIAYSLPLSLSFDHRAATGGEATRFLGALILALEAEMGS